MLTIEMKELQAAVKSPKSFFLDLQKRHAPRLLAIKVRPKLESRDAYTEVTRDAYATVRSLAHAVPSPSARRLSWSGSRTCDGRC